MSLLPIKKLFSLDEGKYFKTNFPSFSGHFAESDLNIRKFPEVIDHNINVGIEVEMERTGGIRSGLYSYLWDFRPDGSLRDGGAEAVSRPVKGIWIRHALQSLYAAISTVSFTPRTSIHIHMDVLNLTLKQLTSILLTYLAVESLLYKFVGKDRHENIFCVPLYSTGFVNSLVEFANKELIKQNLEHSRYAGLNLASLRKFGTIEFRQMHGTHDTVKIINWINLLFKVYNFGLRNDLDQTIKKIVELNTNSFYIAFLNEVFEEQVGLLDITDIKTDLEKGVKAVKQSIISNKFFKELKAGLSKNSPAYKQYIVANKTNAKSYRMLYEPRVLD